MASSKRERELARMRAERQAARRAAEAARRRQRNAIIASIVGVALVASAAAGIGLALRDGDDDTLAAPNPTPTATATATAPAKAQPGDGKCTYRKKGEAARKVVLPPPTGVETKRKAVATLELTQGTVQFEMDATKTPCTANSIRSLSHFGYFDDTQCHRLTTEGIYVLQCGDPTGQGTGGPGYEFDEENLDAFGKPGEGGQVTYPAGTVAMANAGAGTNGSQFFLVYKDSPLAPNYTPFGRITKGLDIIQKIAAQGSEPPGDGKPKAGVKITKMRAKLI